MPLYDFVCGKCDKVEERLVSHSELDTQVCTCGADEVMIRQTPNTMAFVLKGRWFKTTKGY